MSQVIATQDITNNDKRTYASTNNKFKMYAETSKIIVDGALNFLRDIIPSTYSGPAKHIRSPTCCNFSRH